MKIITHVVAAVASGLVMWIVAGVWHEIAAATFYAERLGGEHQGVALILIGYVLLGAIMAVLYPLLDLPGNTIARGLLFGAIIGLIWVLPHGLVDAAVHGQSMLYEIQNGAWHLVEQSIGGLIVAYTYAKFRMEPKR